MINLQHTWARDLVERARHAGSTHLISRAAATSRSDVAVVVTGNNASRDFRTHYLQSATVAAGLTVEHFPQTNSVRICHQDGTHHHVHIVVLGSDSLRGLPPMPILFDPSVIHLLGMLDRLEAKASPSDVYRPLLYCLRWNAVLVLGAALATGINHLLRPYLGHWSPVPGLLIGVGYGAALWRSLRRERKNGAP